MKVVLRKKVENLGEPGDVVDVRGGYARNYLVPEGIVYCATDANIRQVEIEKKKKDLKEHRELEDARSLAEKVSALSITVPVMTGEDEKLFGSVTSMDIKKALAAEGVEIDRRKILLEEPIKELGVYTVRVKLHREADAELKVWVVEK